MARSPKANAAGLLLGRHERSIFMIRCCLSASQTFRPTVSSVLVPSMNMSCGRQNALQPRTRPPFDPKLVRCWQKAITAAVPVILDVEQYSVDVRLDISHINPDTSTVDSNILKLEQIIGWFKNEAPTLQVGFYDVAAPVGGLPVTGHQPANDAELAIWERANSYLIPFVTHVDALYPSLYTFHTDPAKWVAYAQKIHIRGEEDWSR